MLFRKNKKNNRFHDENEERPEENSGELTGTFDRGSDLGMDTSDIFGAAPYESDWKPFVQYIDEEDNSDGIETIEEEEFGFKLEIEETDHKINEEENKEEQYALDGENADSFREGEARYDGGCEQAAERYQSAEGNGFFEVGSDSSGCRGEEEGLASERGSGERGTSGTESSSGCGGYGEAAEEAERGSDPAEKAAEKPEKGAEESCEEKREEAGHQEKTGSAKEEIKEGLNIIFEKAFGAAGTEGRGTRHDPYADDDQQVNGFEVSDDGADNESDDQDDFDFYTGSFGQEENFEFIDAGNAGWNRKMLRNKAGKSGLHILADDEVLTAAEAFYIDRASYNQKKAEELRLKEEADAAAAEVKDLTSRASDPSVPGSAGNVPEHMIGPLTELGILGGRVPAPEAFSEKNLFSEAGTVSEGDTAAPPEQAQSFTEFAGGMFEPAESDGSGAEQNETDFGFTEDYSDGAQPDEEGFRNEGNAYYDYVFEDDPAVLKKKNIRKRVFSVVKEILKNVLIFILVFLIVIMGYLTYSVYIQRTNHVYGSSMEPTLHEGDKVRSSLMPYVFGKPEVGDIVIIDTDRIGEGFNYFDRIADVLKTNKWIAKTFFNGQPEDTLFIKRVVGVEGDLIEFRDDHFYRNGELVYEDYINDQFVYTYPNGYSQRVPEGCVFVMGDNRNVSYDSRSDIGFIPVYTLTGKVNN